VSIAVTSTELEAAGGATGAPVVGISPATGAPVVGISPAIAVAESTQANAADNIKRFILFSFVIEDARTLVIIPDSFRE
jgi:hypothetical protein